MKKALLGIVILLLFSISPCFAFLTSYTIGSGTWSPTNPQAGLTYYKDNRYSLTLTAVAERSETSITGEDSGVVPDGSATSFSFTLAHFPVKTSSYVVHYTISSVVYTGVDDGSGNITGTNISSGTINYNTGAVSLTFSLAPDNGSTITSDYNYYGEGSASITINDLGLFQLQGFCILLEPNDTNPPTSSGGYDFELLNDAGIDVIQGGQGSGVSNTSATRIWLDVTYITNSMTLNFSNLGNNSDGEVTVTIIFDSY